MAARLTNQKTLTHIPLRILRCAPYYHQNAHIFHLGIALACSAWRIMACT
jgi:hypothetical protein